MLSDVIVCKADASCFAMPKAPCLRIYFKGLYYEELIQLCKTEKSYKYTNLNYANVVSIPELMEEYSFRIITCLRYLKKRMRRLLYQRTLTKMVLPIRFLKGEFVFILQIPQSNL